MNYKLLVLDLDGTLTNSKKEITDHTLKTLLKAQEMGVKIVLASGRPTYGIVPLAKQLEMDKFDGFILSFNGGKIINYQTMEVVYESVLPKDLTPSLHLLSCKSDTVILSYRDQLILTEHPEDKYVQHEIFLTKMEPQKVDDFSEAVDFAPEKCLIVGDPEKLIPLEKEVMSLYSEQLNAFRSEPFFLEVVPKGIDKAKSLQRLLDHIGETKESMIAIGDGFNDKSMIEFAGLGIAMANAQEEVKKASDFVTLSNEEDGVAFAVEKYIF